MRLNETDYLVDRCGFTALTEPQSEAIQKLNSRHTSAGLDWLIQHHSVPDSPEPEPTTARVTSNVERVTHYMEFSSPLNQAFVIEALTHYARRVVTQQDRIRRGMQGGFVSGDAWIQCATEWIAQLPPAIKRDFPDNEGEGETQALEAQQA